MRDVTDEMLDYAAARIALWNTFFRRRAESSQRNEILEDFQEIDRLLLLSIVRREIPEVSVPEDFFLGESCIAGLEVALADPEASVAVLVTGERAGFSNRSWRRGIELSGNRQMRIDFVEYFDWNQTGFLTGSLCRGRIAELDGSSELIGHDLLIDLWRVRFWARAPDRSPKH